MNTSRIGEQFILSKEFMNYYSDTYLNTDSYSDTDLENVILSLSNIHFL